MLCDPPTTTTTTTGRPEEHDWSGWSVGPDTFLRPSWCDEVSKKLFPLVETKLYFSSHFQFYTHLLYFTLQYGESPLEGTKGKT